MADTSDTTLKRATTMEVTAEEGHKIVAEEGATVEETADHLRSGQTFKGSQKDEENEAASLKKTLTMAQTVKEAEGILGDQELGRTRGQDQAPAAEEDSGDGESTPALTKTMTMAETVKESAQIVESLGDGADAGTRAEAKQIEEAVKKSEEEVTDDHKNGADAAVLKRKGTMLATAEEGEEFLKRQKLSEANGADATVKEVEA